MSQTEIDALPDAAFYDMAAKAYFLEKKESETVQVGILLAVRDVFGK